MAAKVKDFKSCSHCGRDEQTPEKPDGYTIRNTKNSSMRMISCPCGVMTRLCSTKAHLQSVWNSRPGKPVKVPTITVKSPLTTKVNPALLKTGANTTVIPDEF